jgi:polyisoprenoid-binding protein YceI
MLRPLICSTVVVALLGTASLVNAQAPTQQASADRNAWTIDANHTAAQFAVRHLLVSTVRGQFDKLSGTLTWDGKDVRTVVANITIDAASVNTRVQRRDDDLRSANFFEVDKFPTITFVSKRAEPVDAGHFRLVGDLTIKGVTREVALDAETPTPPARLGQQMRTGTTATTRIKRQDFGLLYNRMVESAPVVGDEITITIDVEATRRAN